MHYLILSLLAAAIAFAGFGPANATSNLRRSVEMTGPEVRVNDLFTGAESREVIATTPEPGRRLVLDVYALQRIAKKYGIGWRPRSRYDQAVITRQSRVLEIAEIEDVLRRELAARGMPEERKIELSKAAATIHIATGLTQPYRIENADMDARTGRVSAILAVATDTGNFVRHKLDGTTYTVIDIPVLNRRIRRGETIEAHDVIWQSVRRDTVGRNIVLDRDAVTGQAARRYLQAGRPLNIDDLEAPKIVRKGSLVTVYFETKNLLLTAKARASEDGALNDTIRVVNLTGWRLSARRQN